MAPLNKSTTSIERKGNDGSNTVNEVDYDSDSPLSSAVSSADGPSDIDELIATKKRKTSNPTAVASQSTTSQPNTKRKASKVSNSTRPTPTTTSAARSRVKKTPVGPSSRAKNTRTSTNNDQATGDDRPNPIGNPPVWADGRQALCETLPYYRSYHGGGYCSDGVAYGFMFDKESHPRDYMDQQVVIARAGGVLTKDPNSDSMVMVKDQLETPQIKAVRNNMDNYNPVALITGEDNPNLPCKPPHPYSVLAWFKPTHVWAEKVKGKTAFRYRFEKLDTNSPSWWTPENSIIPVPLGTTAPPHTAQCSTCNQSSQQIYENGWICLHPQCASFWKLGNGEEPDERTLTYDVKFLRQATPWPHSSEPQPLRPSEASYSVTDFGFNFSRGGWKGLACPKCGRCTSRELWNDWVCGSRGCNYSHRVPRLMVPQAALEDIHHPITCGFPISRDKSTAPVTSSYEFANNYRINHFDIPECGRITHFIANQKVVRQRGGPNDMWKDMQQPEIPLQRRALGTGSIKGGSLMNSFALNYGMPYKFVAATASKPFAEAPQAVRDARSRLNWAARCIIPEGHRDFNELLTLGYFEDQSINYHDDGEFGLGPTIGTLSLGFHAIMKIRMKDKHFHGVTKGGNYVDRPPVPGCQHYEAREAEHDELEEITERDEHAARAKELPGKLGLSAKGGKNSDVITMHLNHGDIVIMHGAKIQEYYEHAVEPKGKLRFALTCRYIDPASLKEEDKPAYVVGPDTGFYDGSSV